MSVPPDQPASLTIRPPQLIQSLVGGFNAVASNIYLLLLPVGLDLLLWFGPHLRVHKLLEPGVLDLVRYMRQNGSPDMGNMLNSLENLWRLFLNQYNLLSVLSTFPVGVPSLMAGDLPTRTPLGFPPATEIGSTGQLVLGWLFFSLLGLLLGALYFAAIARVCSQQPNTPDCDPVLLGRAKTPSFRPGVIAWQALQSLALVIVMVMILLVLLVPAILLATFLALISPVLAQLALLLVSFGSIWFLVPLIFSPHGIFMCGLSVLNAIFTSTRVVRYSLPGTGLFLLAVIILYQGLGLLWHGAPETSWMALIGILGNAFIVTGLLAASFIYYRGGLAYVQSLRKPVVISR